MRTIQKQCCVILVAFVLPLLAFIVQAFGSPNEGFTALTGEEQSRILGSLCGVCFDFCTGNKCPDDNCKKRVSGLCGAEKIAGAGGAAFTCLAVDQTACNPNGTLNSCTVFRCYCDSGNDCNKQDVSDTGQGKSDCSES